MSILYVSCLFLTGCNYTRVDFAPQASDLPWQAPVSDEECIDENPEYEDSLPSEPMLNAPKEFALPPHCAPDYEDSENLIEKDHVYNLPELIDLAQRWNPDTRIAWEEARQAAFQIGLTQANYIPQVTADVLGGYQHTPLPVPKPFNPTGRMNFDTAELLPSFVIKWLLFDFGKRDYMIESAYQLSYASNVAFTETHQKLIFDVSKAYFTLDAVKAQVRVAEDALENAKLILDVTESKLERGLEKTTEVAIARREVAKGKYELEQAKAAYNDSYHGLMQAMGLTPTLKLQIAESTGRSIPKGIAEDVNAYIYSALEQRPDIMEAYAKLQASRADTSSAEASYYPKIEFSGYAYQSIASLKTVNSTTSTVNRPATALFLNFSWPLYDGGTRKYLLDTARSKQAAADDKLKKSQDNAIREVAKVYDDVKSSIAEYESALALVEASNIAYDAALDSYKHGLGTFTNLVNASTERTFALSTLAKGYSMVLISAASLAFVTGELTSFETINILSECN
jgi:outer membrane protein TolC